MPKFEFMCLSCGHTFELVLTAREAEDIVDAECPACGSTDTSRTYDEDADVDEEELEDDKDDDEENLGDINLDEE